VQRGKQLRNRVRAEKVRVKVEGVPASAISAGRVNVHPRVKELAALVFTLRKRQRRSPSTSPYARGDRCQCRVGATHRPSLGSPCIAHHNSLLPCHPLLT
jgi:hypothetical protein